jgi:hypothetical protein
MSSNNSSTSSHPIQLILNIFCLCPCCCHPQDLLKQQNIDYSVFGDMVDHSTGQPAYLPLELFDDHQYECRDPQEWVALGTVSGTHLVYDTALKHT